MGFFDDEDPFEDIIKNFFGNNGISRPRYRREAFIRGEEEERVIDLIEDNDYAYFIFELPGYSEEEVSVNIKGNIIEISVEKKNPEGMKDYLAEKLAAGLKYTRKLPDFINPKKFDYTLKNGVLEIKFEKK